MQHLNLKYLESLATQYPNIARASTEIINLQAILNLPKETEHFVSDIHGEYEQFLHILRNGSGAIRNKIEDVFGNTLSARDKKSLAALVYYPEQKVERMKMELSHEDSPGLVQGFSEPSHCSLQGKFCEIYPFQAEKEFSSGFLLHSGRITQRE